MLISVLMMQWADWAIMEGIGYIKWWGEILREKVDRDGRDWSIPGNRSAKCTLVSVRGVKILVFLH